MQMSGSGKGLVERAEHHCKHDVEGSMKTANRICKGARVLGDGGGDPGMRKLKQQSATGAQEYHGFPVDPPSDRGWTKNAFNRSGGSSPNDIKSRFQLAL